MKTREGTINRDQVEAAQAAVYIALTNVISFEPGVLDKALATDNLVRILKENGWEVSE